MEINKKMKIIISIAISIVILSTGLLYIKNKNKVEEMPYTLFLTHVQKGLVEEVKLSNNGKIEIKLKNGKVAITDNPRTEKFKEELLLYDVKVVEKDGNLNQAIPMLLLVSVMGFTIFYLNRNMSKQAEKEMSNMSKVTTDYSSRRITFDDVAGNEEAKESLMDMVDFIKNPEIYNKFGARLPRGVLLYGAPGTGKTLLAKAMAGEAGVPFYAVSGSDFVQVYAGLGASRIRELFKKAKEAGKSVIFIDEIDSLGKKRKSGDHPSGSEEGDRTLNALLTEMSGFKENEGIIVVAATNRIDILDEALLRPGRFDRQVEVSLPDVNGRYEILKLHSKNKPVSKKVDLKKVALETIYFSGAKLENLMNESAIIAVKEKSKEITMDHINKAYYSVLVGEEKKDRSSIDIKDKEITAYHEAGHALVAKLIAKDNRVTKVSIIPSTKGMGGFSLNIPPDKMYQTKKDILSNIMIALGGRAAEEIIFGKEEITTGASSDLEKATNMTLSMIGVFGMDEIVGLLNYNVLSSRNLDDGRLLNRAKEILEKLYLDTINILNSNMNSLQSLAENLIEKEVLSEDEINKILIRA
ncbi:ATP-dependent metallopeptidase FtsH/Yme1/Tma family protein [Tissierella carlieri]|uniref:ATP-dependent zinc metalloprotease FtsH n=1 Tax=Tissierella carlieri TaxID=689904 RepID=A0ABT1SCI6_9FIRM|nr:FtsH/Yme1/Tma family ATP-dependent metallopeptidase [Tissierella carlieri]MCQ4924207.1 ATP-dependent metallopeptidase FtsH/Yme1/Tma family protein [Tissierella carlieri]MDU5080856.1 ATP-dependent metallopeptidase FtsH/Yme1/Tma family protein [Bacillota bacterium]